MWKCSKCGHEFEDTDNVCWACSIPRQEPLPAQEEKRTDAGAGPGKEKQRKIGEKIWPAHIKKYSGYCPKCKKYHHGVWKECTVCKTPLIHAKRGYVLEWVRRMAGCILLIAIIIGGTYGIQVNERKYYAQSITYLREGKFKESGAEFWRAFSVNPVYKLAKSGVDKVKKVLQEARNKPSESSKGSAQVNSANKGADRDWAYQTITETTRRGKTTRTEYNPKYLQSKNPQVAATQPMQYKPLSNYHFDDHTTNENSVDVAAIIIFLVVLLVVISTSIWVFFDATELCERFGVIEVGGMKPRDWLLLCLLLWIVGFPMYLIKRNGGSESAPEGEKVEYDKVRCEKCRAINYASNTSCIHCGRSLRGEDQYMHNEPIRPQEEYVRTEKPDHSKVGIKTFKYRWRIDDKEFLGFFNCNDEVQLHQHIESQGGKLVEIISQEVIIASKIKDEHDGIKKCPYCDEVIQAKAIKCKHCGEKLIKPKKTVLLGNSCPRCQKTYDASWKVCFDCGTPLRATHVEVEAGEKTTRETDDFGNPRRSPRGSSNGLAIASFVLGILAIFTLFIFGFGMLFAVIAVSIGPGGRDSEYRALASWGIYLGWFVIICFVIVLIFWILFFGGFAALSMSHPY